MPRGSRRLLLLILLAACAGAAWWLSGVNHSLAGPSIPGDGTTVDPGEPVGLSRTDSATADRTGAAIATERRQVTPESGPTTRAATGSPTIGRIALYPSFPMQPFGGSTALELALERDGERVPLTWGHDDSLPFAVQAAAEVPPGVWRIVVVHGPGDRPGLTRSQFWSMEPPEDVTATAGRTTRRMAVLARAVDAPERGTCTIRGFATLDGRPAAHRPVTLAPFGFGGATTRTDADGRFELEDAPAGHAELQLLAIPTPSTVQRAPIHALARLPVAGLDGEILEVALRGSTGSVQLQLLEADGTPALATRVCLFSREVLASVLPNQPPIDQPFRATTGDDGRAAFGQLPAADYLLTIGPDPDDPLLKRRLTIAPGSDQDLGALHLAPRARATIELVIADEPGRSLRRGEVRLTRLDAAGADPLETRVGRHNLARFDHLEPGRYRLTVRSQRSELVSLEPITVQTGENPSIRAVVRPKSDVSPGRRPSRGREIQSQDRR